MKTTLYAAALCAGLLCLAGPAVANDAPAEAALIIDGRAFAGWEEYVTSDYFKTAGKRCAAPEPSASTVESLFGGGPLGLGGADCTSSTTNPDPSYDPGQTYQVPVVVHIIENAAGTQGDLDEEAVYSQIDILNEDFLAIAGTNGAPGTFTGLRFVMADEDPLTGLQSSGITRSNNDSWYNDGGSYWNTLGWDTNRYMNIYTNSASGALGYVPGFPQNGIAGTAQDRVVVLWTAFGRNAPAVPYDQGRTATHELGHYFGLYHTFQSGCDTAAGCYNSGDRICDTNDESNPYFGCAAPRTTCGTLDPRENYMDYSDDLCMNQFTTEQMRRARCTIQSYRPMVYTPIEPDQVFTDGFESGDTTSWNGGSGGNGAGTLLAVTNAAAMQGSEGLEATIPTTATTSSDYLIDNSPGGIDRYRARFYLDPNTLSTDPNKRFKIFTLMSGSPSNYRLATLVLRQNAGEYFLRAKVHDDPASAAWTQIPWATLDNAGPNLIEIDWKRSSGPGAADGYLRLWVNRRPAGAVEGIDNDERALDFVRLGITGGLDPNTTGSFYLDSYESRESLYIGP